MELMESLTPIDSIAIAPNPWPVIIRSRAACGIPGDGFIAALSDRIEKATVLPHKEHVVDAVLGVDGEMISDATSVMPVRKSEWNAFKRTVNQDAARLGNNVYSYPSDTTCEDMLIRGFQLYANHHEMLEANFFPTKYIYGKSFYAEQKEAGKKTKSFRTYFRNEMKKATFFPLSHLAWRVWSELIDEALTLCAEKSVGGELDERRHWAFMKGYCAVCGPCEVEMQCTRCKFISYFGREHQVQDWPIHKKHCKKCTNPGCQV